MWGVVGLGNPGPRYAATRHNVGFWAVDALAKEAAGRFRPVPHGEACEVQWGGERIALLKPLTYMNLSGLAVQPLLQRHKLGLDRLLVVHDDLDLPVGRLRLKRGGSSGGHRGVQSILEAVGAEFIRIKIGVGRPPEWMPVPDYVLRPFASEELPLVQAAVVRATEAVRSVVQDGLERAMNTYNRG